MKNQETNNKDNSQETGCTFFFKNGTTQFVPGANLKKLMDVLNETQSMQKHNKQKLKKVLICMKTQIKNLKTLVDLVSWMKDRKLKQEYIELNYGKPNSNTEPY